MDSSASEFGRVCSDRVIHDALMFGANPSHQAEPATDKQAVCCHACMQARAAALAHNTSSGFITVLRRKSGDELEPVQLPIGSVRASLGALSTFEDVYALLKFLVNTYIDKVDATALRLHDRTSRRQPASPASGAVTLAEYWSAHCGA